METAEGAEFTLVSTSIRGDQPVCGYLGESAMLAHFNVDGSYLKSGRKHYCDLRNAPPKPVETYVYSNVYKECGTLTSPCTYSTRALADKGASSGRVGCIKILLVEGQYDTEE